MNKQFKIALLLLAVLLFFFLELRIGKVTIDLSTFIKFFTLDDLDHRNSVILNARFYRAGTAVFAGSSLALSGLLMQTYFRNALAGPSVLGISSGASLMVALFTLAGGGGIMLWDNWGAELSLAVAAMVGAGMVLLLISFLSLFIRNAVSLLILGLMIGYLTSAMVGLLQFNATEAAVKSFVVWGLGSFAQVSPQGLMILFVVCLAGALITISLLKHLNVLLLGEEYAQSMGVPVRRVKLMMIVASGILVGAVTAFCGPIAFLGLAIPHLARALFKSSNHSIILPAVLLCGAALGLLCDLLTRLPWYEGGLPLNTITSLIGAPVIIYYLFRRSKMGKMV